MPALYAALAFLVALPLAAQVDIPTKPHSVNTLWNGIGAPASSLGTDGDFYIDASAYVIYGPKASGSWPAGFALSLSGGSGSAGSAGPQGPAGAAATIAAGTVSVLAAGSPASVTNVGTSTAARFNFAIPAGPTGAMGLQGPPGATVTTGANYSDSETPAGTINGTNVTFTLGHTPYPPLSLELVKNGVMLEVGQDYSLSGSTLTFINSSQPQTGDSLNAWYRYAGTGTTYTNADAETPGGTLNGTNANFTLAHSPIGNSLQLTRNGLMQRLGVDFTISGASFTFLTGSIPNSGELLQAWYRY